MHDDPEGRLRNSDRNFGPIWYQVKRDNVEEVKNIVDTTPEALDKAGPVGERPLHMAFLYQRDKMARALIDYHVKHEVSLATTYRLDADPAKEKSPYHGENALHIAILWVASVEDEARAARADALAAVRYLLDKAKEQNTLAELLLSPASGSFFANGEPKRATKRTSDAPSVYFGETPLEFAVANDQIELVKMLLDAAQQLCRRGAAGYRAIKEEELREKAIICSVPVEDKMKRKELLELLLAAVSPQRLLTRETANKNNLFHLCVVHGLVEMWNHVHELVHEHTDGAEAEILKMETMENVQHHTPLELAARLAEKKMLERIIGWPNYSEHPYAGCKLLWKYGEIECCLVPLKLIDPKFDRTKRDDGLLCTIDKFDRWQLLEDGQIAWELLQRKWLTYGQRDFWKRMIKYSVLLAIFSWSTLNDSPDLHVGIRLLVTSRAWPTSPCVTFFTIGLFIVALQKLVVELREILVHGVSIYFRGRNGARTVENYASFFGCTSFLLSLLVELVANTQGQSDSPIEVLATSRLLGAVAAFCAWFYVFFFLLGFQSCGTLIVMLSEMLYRDVARFLSVYIALLAAWTHALLMIANSDQRTQHTVLHTVRYWVMTMFEADVSDDVEKVVKRIRESPAVGGHHFLFEGILLCYLVGINLLAINTLVAMMSKTYERIEDSNKLRWRLEKLRILLSMESEYQAQGADGARCRSYFTEGKDGERFLMVHQKTKKGKASKKGHDDDANDDDTTDQEDKNDPLAAAEEGGPLGPFSVYILFAWIIILGCTVFLFLPVGRGG